MEAADLQSAILLDANPEAANLAGDLFDETSMPPDGTR